MRVIVADARDSVRSSRYRRATIIRLVCVAFSALALVGCTSDAEPPAFESIALPTTSAEISAAFDALPDRFGELARDDRLRPTFVSYGRQAISVRAFDVSTGEFWPAGSRAGDVLDTFATGADWEVLGTGSRDDRGWVRIRTSATDGSGLAREIHGLQLADRGSVWLFTMNALSSEQLDRLIEVFSEAVAEQ